MFASFRTLRVRLTILYVAMFAVLQLALWLVVDFILTSYLYSRFDRQLLERAQAVAESIDASKATMPDAPLAERVRSTVNAFTAENTHLNVIFTDTGETVRSASLRGFKLPRATLADELSDRPMFRTLVGADVEPLVERGERMRLVTLPPDESHPFHLQVAASLRPMARVIGELRQLLMLFVLVSLVVAGSTSWIMAQRAFQPIRQIARKARGLSATTLSERLPAPEASDEIAELVHVLNEMLDRLETQFRNQQRFIADVSHELKTPLSVLLGESQLRRTRPTENGQWPNFVEVVEEQARRMLRTVETFLVLTRARQGGQTLTRVPVAVDEIVLASVQKCGREARKAKVKLVPRLHFEGTADEPIVLGDGELLRSCLESLITHAVSNSPEGASVEIEARVTDEQATIAVRDAGPGIPDEDLQRVFDMFYQNPQDSRQVDKGGVGLAIAKTVAELHQGQIAVRNRDEGGCEFILRLPLAEPSERGGLRHPRRVSRL